MIHIQSDRLSLVPFTRQHVTAEFIAWLNDKTLMRYSEQRHKVHDEASCLAYIKSFEGTDNYYFAIERNDKEKSLIGSLTVYQDKHNGLVDIGIMIAWPAAQNQGFGTEAWCAIIDWIKANLNPRKITAGTLAINKAMLGVMEKSGMVLDGVRKKHYVVKGECVDMIYMALFMTNNE